MIRMLNGMRAAMLRPEPDTAEQKRQRNATALKQFMAGDFEGGR